MPHLPDDVAVAFEPDRAIDELRGGARRRQIDEDADRVRPAARRGTRHLAVELDDDPDGIGQHDAADVLDRDDRAVELAVPVVFTGTGGSGAPAAG